MPSGCGRKSPISWSRCGHEGVLGTRIRHYRDRGNLLSTRDHCRAHAQKRSMRGQDLPRRESPMKMSSALRAALVALTAFAGAALSSTAHADEGTVSLVIYKAGWIIGGSGGSGVLTFRGRSYQLSTGGLDYGLV